MWIDVSYDPTGTDTVDVLAPKTPEEQSLVIKSLHLSKFADKDADGNDILAPMLKAWGVNTVVIIGAWTEDCVLSTAMESVDRYGFDTIIIKDAVGTATPSHTKAIEVMGSAVAKVLMADELIEYLDANPDKIVPPQAELSYEAVKAHHLFGVFETAEPKPATYGAVPLPLVVALVASFSMVSALVSGYVARRRALDTAGQAAPQMI